MKRSTWWLLALLCVATSLFAQDAEKSKEKQVAGTICNSACVQPVNGVSTCNTSCTDRSGDVVLVDDLGKLKTIANPKMATPHMNKQVKCTVVPTEKDREDLLRIIELSEVGG
jgi:hypothetical protein